MKKLITYSGILLAVIFAVALTGGTAHAQMMGGYRSYGPMMEGWTYSDATSSELSATGTEASQTLPEGRYYNNVRSWSAPDGNYFGYMPMMGYYGYGPMMGYGYGDAWWEWIVPVLFWVLLVVGVITLIRWLRHDRRGWHHGHGYSAIDVLRERYAKGEIDKKEFEEKKKDLES